MKKIISVLLTLSMLAAFIVVPTFAAETTVGSVAADYKPAEGAVAITDAAGFAAMTADGSYYLANDITIDATYAEVFAGTLDGNGKTITTSAPLFATLGSATIKNLTVAGEIVLEDYAAAIAIEPIADATILIENVNTNANIVSAKEANKDAAAYIAYCSYDNAQGTTITITDCENNGNVSGGYRTGAIAGYYQGSINAEKPLKVIVKNFVNNGKIESTQSYAGGLISRVGGDKKTTGATFVTIDDSVNNGQVVSAISHLGGFCGYMMCSTIITNCVNNADLTATEGVKMSVGGILGTSSTKKKGEQDGVQIINCVNNGKISTTQVGGGIAGKLGNSKQTATPNIIDGCVNNGDVVLSQFISDYAYLGGIAGYAYGGTVGNTIKNSINLGNVSGDATGLIIGAGILAYINSTGHCIQNNINAGQINITSTGDKIVVLTFYNKGGDDGTNICAENVNNYSIAIEGIVADINGSATPTSVAVTAAQIESGEVAYLINEAAGATIYYQAVGTDKAPVLTPAEDGSNSVVKNADGTYGNPVKEEETTAPDTTPDTTEPGSSKDTGDSAVIFAAIALISLAGIAVVSKKKEN